jgi:thioester reductase-like protein
MRRRVEFNHVSTLGWLPAGHPEALAPVVNESDLLSKSGYAQSKYVAEHVLLECRRRYGLPSRVFRPGVISGSTVTGAANRVDSVVLMIRGLVREGAVCCGPGSPLPATFNLCPVDTVARAIVQVGEARRSCDTAYHVCAPTEVSLAQLVGWLRDAGCVLEETGVIPFCARMRQTAEDHPLFPFKSMLSSPRPPLHALVVASAHSVRDSPALLTIQPESARGLCREQLHLTLMFFERNGLLLSSPSQQS